MDDDLHELDGLPMRTGPPPPLPPGVQERWKEPRVVPLSAASKGRARAPVSAAAKQRAKKRSAMAAAGKVPPVRGGAEAQFEEPQSESFLNMMDDAIDIETFSMSNEVEEVSAPKPQKRSSNYTHDEDIQLCKSWINISTDAIVGNEQPSKSYWARIAEHYHENRTFDSDRSSNSLEHRWSVLQKECMKWQANFEQVERRHPSGIPYKEHMKECHALYASGEPKNRAFQYVHCWLEVRHTPKFLALHGNSKRPRSTPSDEVGDGDDDSKSPTPDTARQARPLGRKKSKELMKNAGEGGSYKEALKDLLQVREKEAKMRENRWKEAEDRQERKLSLEERKFQWEQEQKIMFCDVNALEPNVKVWVLAMRSQMAATAAARVGGLGGDGMVGGLGEDA